MLAVSTRARVALAVPVALLIAAATAAPAFAEATITACMPYTTSTGKLATGKPIVAGTETGTCKNTSSITYHPLNLPSGAGFETLNKLLAHMTFVASGVGGKPTIQFSGVNVQIVNGENATGTVNGEGNLVIGYDENPENRAQTGSHNLILGQLQSFTSFGGVLGGFKNATTAPYASASGGFGNTASGELSSVSGGELNTASGSDSAVSGGIEGKASGVISSVSGGKQNQATSEDSSVSGGVSNSATGELSSVSGGELNRAKGELSWVGGGFKNLAEGRLSAVFGGVELTAFFEADVRPSCRESGEPC